MKKTLILGLTLLLAACACHNGCCRNSRRNGTCQCHSAHCQKNNVVEAAEADKNLGTSAIIPIMYKNGADMQDTPTTMLNEVSEPVKISATAIETFSCAPSATCKTQEPVVLKPRVTEVVGDGVKRPCCDDAAELSGNVETYVPDAPEIYVIAANRTINLMQDEAAPLFKQVGNMKIYVGESVAKSEDLPGGIDKGRDIIQKRLSQMENITVTADKLEADFRIDSSADWYDTPTKTVPAVKYDITLKDKGDNLIGEWSEIVHQADGDRSWW